MSNDDDNNDFGHQKEHADEPLKINDSIKWNEEQKKKGLSVNKCSCERFFISSWTLLLICLLVHLLCWIFFKRKINVFCEWNEIFCGKWDEWEDFVRYEVIIIF